MEGAFHVEEHSLDLKWLSSLPRRPFRFLRVQTLGGGRQLRAALLPLKFCAAERVAELVLLWGTARISRNACPTCIALFQLHRLLSPFALNACCRRDFGRQLFGEEALAGRICIGCAGFRTEGCWKCRVSPGPDPHGRVLCTQLAHATLTARPWNAVLESSATRTIWPPASRGCHLSSQKLPERGVSVLPIPLPLSSFRRSYYIWIWILQNLNLQSVKNNKQSRSSDPLSVRDICTALSSLLPQSSSVWGLKKLTDGKPELP